MAPVHITGVYITAKAGVISYLPESWGHRVKAPSTVFADRHLKTELACFPYKIRERCVGEVFFCGLANTGKARYSETEWHLLCRCNQGGTAEILFVPDG